MYKTALIFLVSALVFLSCKEQQTPDLNEDKALNELFTTHYDISDNVDSPAFYSKDSVNWIIATCKKTDALIIYDALNGKTLKKISSEINLSKPNGIKVVNDLLFVVERGNRQISIFSLPDFRHLDSFGQNELINPYGLEIITFADNRLIVYVSDSYTVDRHNPAASDFSRRIKMYRSDISSPIPKTEFIKSFGENAGSGKIEIIESIAADKLYGNLLAAEEQAGKSSLKVYSLEGIYKNISIGDSIFTSQAEGIALIEFGDGGFWIATDQSHENNRFHIFDRRSFAYLGHFSGKNTTNTDGVAASNKSIGKFSKGLFYACNNDGGISAFDMAEIIERAVETDTPNQPTK